MRIFRSSLKHIATACLLLSAFVGGGAAFAEADKASDQATESHHAHGSQDWPGIYNGLLPCDDCYGIKTSLALNKNGSYILISKYAGKSEREFVEKGKFVAGDKSNTIILTPRNSSTSRQYLVGDNMLIQLGDNGERISGKLADRYILRRMDMTSEPQSHSGH